MFNTRVSNSHLNLLKSLIENKNQLSMVIEEESEEALAISIIENIEIEDCEDEI